MSGVTVDQIEMISIYRIPPLVEERVAGGKQLMSDGCRVHHEVCKKGLLWLLPINEIQLDVNLCWVVTRNMNSPWQLAG